MTDAYAAAPLPAFRLIPSQFPPIGLFDSVSMAADLAAVMELVGWTNDRFVADRIARLPRSEWAYGRPNSSIVMGAFLHVPPGGMRFNGAELGAWYAADDLRTSAAEVGHHLRRETLARALPSMSRRYRAYSATLLGEYLDIRGQQLARADIYASDRYDASQMLGEKMRASGGAGILYDSLRRRHGQNVAAHRPLNITEIVQTDHFEITVSVAIRTIEVRKLTAT
ncbi:MAG: RES family NAD+ phosphorylase [Hyphomicrobiales bacterium]|nr:RES family NAD+ phosphorylase [Hyphomicrobiales bacterium]